MIRFFLGLTAVFVVLAIVGLLLKILLWLSLGALLVAVLSGAVALWAVMKEVSGT
jgi:hypothetical protein